jgi:uncharacterized protein
MSQPLALVSGSSGFLGSALVPALLAHGWRVRLLRRGPAKSPPVAQPGFASSSAQPNLPAIDYAHWDPARGLLDPAVFAGVQAVIHLGGANIAAGPWTARRRALIRDSRLLPTRLIADTLAALPIPPAVFICASGANFYPADGQSYDEQGPAGSGFLADVCVAWEAATVPARSAGIRTITLRTGMVLGTGGGALPRMRRAYALGLGGVIGSGDQWMSWIHVVDWCRMVCQMAADPRWRGPVNVVAPEPVTQRVFSAWLAAEVHRPALFRVPAWAIRLTLGDMGKSLLLDSLRVVPNTALRLGFIHSHPHLAAW